MTLYAIIDDSKRDENRLLTRECFVGQIEAVSRQSARRQIPLGYSVMLVSELRRWHLTALQDSIERQNQQDED